MICKSILLLVLSRFDILNLYRVICKFYIASGNLAQNECSEVLGMDQKKVLCKYDQSLDKQMFGHMELTQPDHNLIYSKGVKTSNPLNSQ